MLRITLSIDQFQTTIKDKVYEAYRRNIISSEAKSEYLKCFVCQTETVQELLKQDEGLLLKECEKMRANMNDISLKMDEVKRLIQKQQEEL